MMSGEFVTQSITAQEYHLIDASLVVLPVSGLVKKKLKMAEEDNLTEDQFYCPKATTDF